MQPSAKKLRKQDPTTIATTYGPRKINKQANKQAKVNQAQKHMEKTTITVATMKITASSAKRKYIIICYS